MTTRLDPPPVPPLTPDEHGRLRRSVLTRTRPVRRSASRWVPALAVIAVAAVIAGTVTVTHLGDDEPQSSNTPSRPPAAWIPTDIDLGPADTSADADLLKSCTPRLPVSIVWARRVKGLTSGSMITVSVQQGRAPAGLSVCVTGQASSPVPGWVWNKQPTPQQRLVVLGTDLWAPLPGPGSWTLYRAAPDIARIESRFVWPGGSGPWIKGVVDNGYAYTDTRAAPTGEQATEVGPDGKPFTTVAYRQETRAYDAAGRQVEIPRNPTS